MSIQAMEEVIAMRTAGKTGQEIADHLRLEKKQIKNWVNGHNKSQARLLAGVPPKQHGPRKGVRTGEAEYNHERIQTKNEVAPLALRHST